MRPNFGFFLAEIAPPYLVRIRQHDGSMRNLPETFVGPAPPRGAEIPIQVDGESILARVESHSEWHSISPENGEVQPVKVVTVTPVPGPST